MPQPTRNDLLRAIGASNQGAGVVQAETPAALAAALGSAGDPTVAFFGDGTWAAPGAASLPAGALGSLLYHDGTDWVAFPVGDPGYSLQSTGATITWAASSSGGGFAAAAAAASLGI